MQYSHIVKPYQKESSISILLCINVRIIKYDPQKETQIIQNRSLLKSKFIQVIFRINFEIAYFQLRTNNEFLKRLIDKIQQFYKIAARMNQKSFSPTSYQQKQSKKQPSSMLLQRNQNYQGRNGDELKICETNLVNLYKANNKLMLSKETQEKIKKSLQIHGAAEAGYTQRENYGRFFLTYNNNPFTQDFYRKTLNYDELEKLSKTEKIDIFDAQRKKKKTVQSGNDLKQKFFRLDQTLTQLSRRILKNRTQINFDKKSNKLHQDPLIIVPAIFQMSQQSRNHIEQLQRIVNLRQQKACLKGHQDIDIFKFLFNPKAKSFETMLQRLLKYNFQIESVVYQLIKQSKINPFNHISTYSRSCMTSRKKRTMAQLRDQKTELATKIDDIKFQQLLFLVAGKVRSEELLQYLSVNFQQKNQFQEAKVYLESRQSFNVYQPNQRNKMTYVDKSIQSIQRQWVNLPYEISYKEKMTKIKKIYQFCTQFNIQDQTLNDYLNVRKERLVCGLFDNNPHRFKNIDTKVLRSKRFKDGFEKNRNRAVSQILVQCSKFIKPKSKKSKNRDKNKTQSISIKKQYSNIEQRVQKIMHKSPKIKINEIQDLTNRNSPRSIKLSPKNTSPKYSPKHKFQYTTLYSPKKNKGSFSETLSLIQDIRSKSILQKEDKL